ncbi:MAG: LPS export ABC transporter periplasmic protein LptC [Myxococcota bacterium]
MAAPLALEARARSADAQIPPTRLRGVVFEGLGAGRQQFDVRAAHAEVDWALRVATLQSVAIELPESERGSVHVRGDVGRFDLVTENFELEGHVEGTTSRGEHFFMKRLRYHQGRNVLLGDGAVRVERGPTVFEGSGLEIDLETHRVQFTGAVRARVVPR